MTARRSHFFPCFDPSRRASRGRLCLLFGIALALGTRSSSAGQSARLVYSRTAEAVGCSDEPGLRQAVARRLGYDPFVAVSVNTVVAELRGDSDGLKARVYVVRDANMAGGARELSAPSRDCTELVAAVALALSIAIDPDALDYIEQPSPTSVDAPSAEGKSQWVGGEPPATPEAERNSEPRAAPRAAVTHKSAELGASTAASNAPRKLDVSAGLLAFVATGPAPSPSFGFGLAVGVVLSERWVAAIEPALSLKSSASIAGNASAGARVSTVGGTLHLGHQFKGLYGGALFDAERLTSEGYGVLQPVTERTWWVGAGLRIGYWIDLARQLSLEPHLDGIAGLQSLRLQVLGREAHATPPLLGRFGLTLHARF